MPNKSMMRWLFDSPILRVLRGKFSLERFLQHSFTETAEPAAGAGGW